VCYLISFFFGGGLLILGSKRWWPADSG